MKGADRKRWKLTVAKRQGSGRETVAERSRRQTLDHRNTKSQRGRMRATSVLANAKSKDHQDASSRTEGRGSQPLGCPAGVRAVGRPEAISWHEGTAHVLTQGDLRCESNAEVSRGHSSDDAVRKHSGAKGRRNESKATREPVNRATIAQTSAEHSEQSPTTARTQLAQMMQSSQAGRGGKPRPPCDPQETRQQC
jgi:hypothetical protein